MDSGEKQYELRANLCQANLQRANLREVFLARANLQRADLSETDLQKAELQGVDLRGAYLSRTNLQEAALLFAKLQGAYLDETNLQGASLVMANLEGVIYEPNPEKFPSLLSLTGSRNHLDKLVFLHFPTALIALREAFKKAGLRTQERQLTYAIEHTYQLQAWDPSWHAPRSRDKRPWLEKLAGKTESLFNYVLFDLPSHYGSAPGLAMRSLLGFIPCFALLY